MRPVGPLVGMRGRRRGRLVFRAEHRPLIRRWAVILGRWRSVPLRRRGTVPRIVIVVGTIDAAACQQKRRHEQRKKLYLFHVPSRWMAVPIKNNTGGSTRQALRCERAADGKTAGAGTNGVGGRDEKSGPKPAIGTDADAHAPRSKDGKTSIWDAVPSCRLEVHASGSACRDANQDVPPTEGRACCPAAGDDASPGRHGRGRFGGGQAGKTQG